MRLPAALTSLSAAFLLVVLGSGPALASTPDRLDTEKVDEFVAAYLERHGLPGAGVAVVRDGRLVHEAGYGEDSRGEPITEHTRLAVASMSKSFTAFAVLQLVDAGSVDLDRPVERYLPELEMDDPRLSQVTVRQVLSHTSGIATPTVIGAAETLEEGVARTGEWTMSSDPGTSYAYSNANYWIAARLVEVVTGTSFDRFLEENVFGPIGMKDSLNTTTSNEDVPGLAQGHVTAYGTAWSGPEPEQMHSGAGGVVTTAHDMTRWLAMQQREGIGVGGERLLSAALVRESHTVQESAGRSGLGWTRSGAGIEPARVGHSGAVGGFQAQQDLVPSSGYGVAVMLNSFTPWFEHAYAISSGIIEITEGGDPEPGWPIPTMIDVGLGVLTVGVLALGVRGARRATRWARRRQAWSRSRFGLRLVPQLIVPGIAIFLFVVAPALKDNSLTGLDVLRLVPSAMVLVLGGAIVGLVLVVTRAVARAR